MSNRLQRLHASILCGTAKISGALNPNNNFYPLGFWSSSVLVSWGSGVLDFLGSGVLNFWGRHRPGRLSTGSELSAPVSHEYFIFALSALAPRRDRPALRHDAARHRDAGSLGRHGAG